MQIFKKINQNFKNKYLPINSLTHKQKTNESSRLTHSRLLSQIEKNNPTLKVPKNIDRNLNITKTASETSEYNYRSNPISQKKIKDTFGKYPINIISKDEQKVINNSTKEMLQHRTNKVGDYLGSKGVISSVTRNDKATVDGHYHKQGDKITNVNKDTVKLGLSQDSKKFLVKSFKRNYEDNRVFYV